MARPVCSVVDCTDPVDAKERRGRHYKQWRRTEPASPVPAPRDETPTSTSWQRYAACRTADPEMFYPVATTRTNPDVQAAIEFCGHCPVRAACLEWALRHLPYGIAGGMTENERRALRRALRRHRAEQPVVEAELESAGAR